MGGSNFESMLMREMCHIFNIKKSITTAYYPEENGLMERTNHTLKNSFKAFLNPEDTRDWDIALPRCLLAYRATVHAPTGQTPQVMVSSRGLRLASDVLLPADHHEPLLTTEHIHQMHSSLVRGQKLARLHLQAAQRQQRAYFGREVYGTE
ncbi:Transposon Ty3-I gap-Pol polyprotein [Paragonimus heterotremus]|uniref:Transposon Ty3-I gap-Pol polyprotein n=1 Tax=Paragonimus heterotremus TaxID=100268 RepID=A0A8J4SM44_9TREM|nr:Transposon Ty3-I gap-Pol polyprotein [Paragonimus heterotremus]